MNPKNKKNRFFIFGVIMATVVLLPLMTFAFTKVIQNNSGGQGEGSSIPDTLECDADKILICHKPNTPASQELCVEPNALQQHIDHGDASGACSTPTVDSVDLFIDKTVNNHSPSEGEEINFIITVTNQGPDTATNIVVSEQFPTGMNYINSQATTGSYDSVTGVWEIPELSNGTSAFLDVTVIIDAGASGQTLINEVEVTGVDQEDSDLSNNSFLVDIFVNSSPVAQDDNYTVNEDEELSVPAHGVFENDVDGDYDELSATVNAPPEHGTLVLNEDGSFVYTPNENYFGEDIFKYQGCDSGNICSNADVYITIDSVNDAPEAHDDVAGTTENASIIIEVLSDDIDVDNDALTIISVSDPQNGSVEINDDNTVTYTPNADYAGTDSFSYSVSDGQGGQDSATVEVTINSVNQAPLAVDDYVSVDEDGSVVIDVLENDSDADGDSLVVSEIHAQPAHGSAVLNGDNTITYTPDADYNGPDHFGYLVCDNELCNEAEIFVTVDPINDAPQASEDEAGVATNGSVTIDVLADDIDVDNDTLTIVSVSEPASGSATIDNNTVIYTPVEGFSGTDSFTYVVEDGQGGQDSATVSVVISATDQPPVPVDDFVTVDEDSSVVINVLANDSDADGDSLTVSDLHAQPAHGTAVVNADYSVTYTPNADYNGPDNFGVTVCDAVLCNESAVLITVNSVNDQPQANDDDAGTIENEMVIIEVLADDIDVDNDDLSIVSVTQPENGTVEINEDNTVTYYFPDNGFSGTDSFSYVVQDGNGGQDSATVSVVVGAIDQPPIPVDDYVAVDEDDLVVVDVLANDNDADGDNLVVSEIHAQPAHGTAVINSDNTITYTPDENYNGDDSFGYLVCEDNSVHLCNEAAVFITVNSVNDAPDAYADSQSTMQNHPVVIDPLANDNDVEGDVLSISLDTEPANGTIVQNNDDTMTYTPDTDFVGEDSFTYIVQDSGGGLAIVSVQVMVNAAPDVGDDQVVIDNDDTIEIDVLGNDSDQDGDSVVIGSVSGSTLGGNVFINDNHTPTDLTDDVLVYTPPAGSSGGDDKILYTVTDGHGNIESGTVTVTLEATEEGVDEESIGASICFHCDLVEYELYIINPDGSERVMGTDYTQSEQIAENVFLYKFEDKGMDFDYNDVEIVVDNRICAKPIFSVVSSSSAWDHQIRVRIMYRHMNKKEILLWESSEVSVGQEEIVDLNSYQEDICFEKKCNLSCDDIDFTCYIVNPDGTKRFSGTKYAKKEKIGENVHRYMFEDRGYDFDYNDAAIEVDLTDCRNATIKLMQHPLVDHRLHHEVWVQAKAKDGRKVDFNIWRSTHAHEETVKAKRFNLADHEELCSD